MRVVTFRQKAENQFNEWVIYNPKIEAKISQLLANIVETPYEGLGKPEALKHNYAGYWSRRINKEHRLIYQVTETEIIVVSCKFHY